MNLKKHIPNAFTCGNLLCGCIAIVHIFNGDLVMAAYLVGLAAVLDFFDGFVARLLKVHSDIGKQLDSLADGVTFGVVPAMVMYMMLKGVATARIEASADAHQFGVLSSAAAEVTYLPYIAFLIAIFSIMRLAKFNIDTRQSDSFIGVPTPANAILICSFPLIYHLRSFTDITAAAGFPGGIIFNYYVLIGLTLLMSYLLVAELPLFALKFKSFAWKGNEIRFLFLALSLTLLLLLGYSGIPFIIALYIGMSVINNLIKKGKPTAS